MRIQRIAALLLLAQPCCAEEEAMPVPVTCEKDTVVLFGKDEPSSDRYALGWTIRPLKKDAKPVDWSQYLKKGNLLASDYDWDDERASGQNDSPSYVLVDGVVDLTTKIFRDLPLSKTYFTTSTHGWNITAKWLEKDEAIVIVDSRFYTSDLLLVRVSKDGLSTIDLMPKANHEVEKLIAQKRPLAGKLEIMYDNGEAPVVRDGVIRLAFSAWHPKGSQEDMEGTLFLSKKDGTPVRAECSADTPEDHPFTGELGRADERLNEVYDSLRKSLKSEARGQLLADQKKWITLRNDNSREAAEEKVPFYQEGSTREAYLATRNQEALKLTCERVDTLQKQLAAIARN